MLATTRVTVVRADSEGLDPYEEASTDETAVSVPAHISAPTGDDVVLGGSKEVVTAVVLLPSTTVLERDDRIHDQTTGETYSVVWHRRRTGLGLDHVKAGLRAVKGAAGD